MYTEWTEAIRTIFLKNLAATGNVVDAARLTGVSRSHAYKVRVFDTDFAFRWEEAELEAKYRVEYEARRRALETLEEPMIHRGTPVRDQDGTPILIRRYNDRMLTYLLRRIEHRRADAARYKVKAYKAERKAAAKTSRAAERSTWHDDDRDFQ